MLGAAGQLWVPVLLEPHSAATMAGPQPLQDQVKFEDLCQVVRGICHYHSDIIRSFKHWMKLELKRTRLRALSGLLSHGGIQHSQWLALEVYVSKTQAF